MKQLFKGIHGNIKQWLTQVLFKKYLTPFALVLVYVFIVGLTCLVARAFFRKALKRSSQKKDSNWIDVTNYEGSFEESLKQS